MNIEWCISDKDSHLISDVMCKYSLNELEASVMLNRFAYKQLSQFFSSYDKKVCDIINIQALAKIIYDFRNKVIGIISDYDADGITSAAMWIKFFRACNIRYKLWMPKNRTVGYGATQQAIDEFNEYQIDLLLTLDCSITKSFHDINYMICTIDHHLGQKLHPNTICVNPHQNSDLDKYKDLSTAGLSYFVIEYLKSHYFYVDIEIDTLACIGTLGDIMPVTGINRQIIQAGVNAKQLIGVKILCELLQKEINYITFMYYVIPCLNAAGRISDVKYSLEFLLTDDVTEAYNLAKILISLNEQRKKIEEETYKDVCVELDTTTNILIATSEKWHSGVLGIVASRLTKEFNKPVFLFRKQLDVHKGSARSNNVHIGHMIQQSVQIGLAVNGGGHKNAGGATISVDKFAEWSSWMQKNIIHNMSSVLNIDLIATLQNVRKIDLSKIEPFGHGHPAPFILIRNIYLCRVTQYNNHLMCTFDQKYNFFMFRCSAQQRIKITRLLNKYVNVVVQYSSYFPIIDIQMTC